MKKRLQIFKIGGNVINSDNDLTAFLKDFAEVEGHKLLVHGGGAVANELMKKMGIEPEMVDGRRITDEATMEMITMVYAGLINKKVVAGLQKSGVDAMGLSGADGNVITAVKRAVKDVDYGLAGDIVAVNSRLIDGLLNLGLVPVFNSVVHDGNGLLLNTNADTIASEVAIAMSDDFAVDLIYVFEKKGVLSDLKNETVISEINKNTADDLAQKGIINSGMLPKLHNCFRALENGVERVFITGKDNFKKVQERGTQVLLNG